MSLPIRLTEEALLEEAEAFLFYEKASDGLGERFLKELEEKLYEIAAHPFHYTFIDTTNTIRDVALKHFPFVIIYEVKATHVEVYHIHHTKKDH